MIHVEIVIVFQLKNAAIVSFALIGGHIDSLLDGHEFTVGGNQTDLLFTFLQEELFVLSRHFVSCGHDAQRTDGCEIALVVILERQIAFVEFDGEERIVGLFRDEFAILMEIKSIAGSNVVLPIEIFNSQNGLTAPRNDVVDMDFIVIELSVTFAKDVFQIDLRTVIRTREKRRRLPEDEELDEVTTIVVFYWNNAVDHYLHLNTCRRWKISKPIDQLDCSQDENGSHRQGQDDHIVSVRIDLSRDSCSVAIEGKYNRFGRCRWCSRFASSSNTSQLENEQSHFCSTVGKASRMELTGIDTTTERFWR